MELYKIDKLQKRKKKKINISNIASAGVTPG